MIAVRQKQVKNKEIEKVRTLLTRDFALKSRYAPIDRGKFWITMDNDYLSPKGVIIKKQHLQAAYDRKFDAAISPTAAGFLYTWEDTAFSQQDKKSTKDMIDWTFANGRQFSHCKTFFKDFFSEKEIRKRNESNHNTGLWYDDLINVPAVNLLYMLTWDVIFFEEFNTTLIGEGINAIGETCLVESLSKTFVQLSFKGCNLQHSFFKNGNVYVNFLGISLYNNQPVSIYEYRSAGRLNVEKEGSNVAQEGESFFMGKIYLSLQQGDLMFAELVEILTVSLKNKQGKIVPMQKRRFVQLQKQKQ